MLIASSSCLISCFSQPGKQTVIKTMSVKEANPDKPEKFLYNIILRQN